MRIVDDFPHRVQDIEHLMIPVKDGTRLAARLWLPEDSAARPVPAILEYIPYRKRDGTRLRDEPMHRWFAGHGYAAVRVDLRGSGESEGVLLDEYTATEQDDAAAVIAWIAAQPWCCGNVAMMGKSWGGFGALQVAALRPPALKAVVAVCASDDRYSDDAHYMGGCLLNENLLWGSMLMALCAQPPAPELAGPGWRDIWRQRIAAIEPFPAVWLRHPLRDDYWRHGSICEDFASVNVPVFAVSGWADGYSNAVLRLLQGLQSPRHGLIGPWGHTYPHEGVPGPAIGFLQEVRAFLDCHLRGRDGDWPRRPMLRAFQQEGLWPPLGAADRRGHWIAEERWPSPRIALRALHLGAGTLQAEPAASGAPSWRSPQTTGAAAGAWCAFGLEGEMPGDQRRDDEASLCFDSAPLEEPLAILGAPQLRLRLSVDRSAALICARLCEVRADGTSARITFGLLDLTHRRGHHRAAAMPVGEPTDVQFAMNDTAHRFEAGSRLRLALSTSYWPMAWPAPAPATLTVECAGSRLELPERRPQPEDRQLPPFPPAEAAPMPPFRDLQPGGVDMATRVDPETGETVHVTEIDLDKGDQVACTRFPDIAQDSGHGIRETFRIRPDDPLSARAEVLHKTVARSGRHDARVELRTALWADATAFHFSADLEVVDGTTVIDRRSWRETVPRPDL